MKNRSRKRILAFERLESKATPSSLLLVLAPMHDGAHGALEQALHDPTSSAGSFPAVDASANWQFSVSTVELLHFVETNSYHTRVDTIEVPMPSVEHCRCADEMMRLGDPDVRSMVIADSLGENLILNNHFARGHIDARIP